MVDICHLHLFRLRMYNTNPNEDYRLWVMLTYQCTFISCDKYTTLVGMLILKEPVLTEAGNIWKSMYLLLDFAMNPTWLSLGFLFDFFFFKDILWGCSVFDKSLVLSLDVTLSVLIGTLQDLEGIPKVCQGSILTMVALNQGLVRF